MIVTHNSLQKLITNTQLVGHPDQTVPVGINYVDVSLGQWVGVEKYQPLADGEYNLLVPGKDKLQVTVHDTTHGWAFTPNTFIMAYVAEKIHNATNLTGFFFLDSTLARLGVQHSLATAIIPGWQGILALELTLTLRHNAVKLTAGMPIGKIFFMEHENTVGYAGRYQNQSVSQALGVTESELTRDI